MRGMGGLSMIEAGWRLGLGRADGSYILIKSQYCIDSVVQLIHLYEVSLSLSSLSWSSLSLLSSPLLWYFRGRRRKYNVRFRAIQDCAVCR